jgi:hypothetical protein
MVFLRATCLNRVCLLSRSSLRLKCRMFRQCLCELRRQHCRSGMGKAISVACARPNAKRRSVNANWSVNCVAVTVIKHTHVLTKLIINHSHSNIDLPLIREFCPKTHFPIVSIKFIINHSHSNIYLPLIREFCPKTHIFR